MKCANTKCNDYSIAYADNCDRHQNPAIDCECFKSSEPETPKPSTIHGTQTVIRERLTSDQYFGWLLGNTIEASLNQNSSNTNILNAERIARYAHWMADFLIEEGE